MMRRTARLGCPAALSRIKSLNPAPERSFEEKKAKYEYDQLNEKKKEGNKASHIVTNLAADHHDASIAVDKSKMGKAASQFDGEFATSNADLKQWMDVKAAARLLCIEETKLFGLKEDEVREAWHKQFTLAKTLRERNEVDAAAEVLVEYCSSDVMKERTLDHFARHIIKTKGEIKSTLDQDRQGQRDRIYDALGIGHLMLTAFFVGSIVVMFRFLERHDADLAIAKAKRSFRGSMGQVSNDEPGPDYLTRYRDTPTSLDEHMALPNPEITDPEHRELLEAREREAELEEERLVLLTDDVTFEADKRRRQAQAEQLAERKAAVKNGSRLDLIDGVVKAMPPPAIARLRREEARAAAVKERKFEDKEF